MAVIKGFNVPGGYMGLVPSGKYQLFETERDYIDYMNDEEEGNDAKVPVQTKPSDSNNGKEQRKRKPSEGRPRSLRTN